MKDREPEAPTPHPVLKVATSLSLCEDGSQGAGGILGEDILVCETTLYELNWTELTALFDFEIQAFLRAEQQSHLSRHSLFISFALALVLFISLFLCQLYSVPQSHTFQYSVP